MLHRLRIRNLALVDDLSWELGAGFNTLTGETGAGKSILIDGLNLLMGERADKTLIRSGEESCAVEAEIEIRNSTLRKEIGQLLEEIGAEPCEENILLLKRTVSASGANKQFINGSPVTLQGLKSVGDLLVDVHGPHDHQSLLLADRQLAILDAYGKLQPLVVEHEEAFQALRHLREARENLNLSEREREQKLDTLLRQVKEIESAKPNPGEDIQVDAAYKVASNARQLLEYAGTITGLLSESESAVLSQLAQVEKTLMAWERVDAGLSGSAELNRSAIAQLQELLSAVQNYIEKIDWDAGRLRDLEDRLNLLQSLKRKYGPTLDDVIEFGRKAAEELESLQSRETELARLDEEIQKAEATLGEISKKLTRARVKVAKPLAEKIQGELRGLGFQKALFAIECGQLDETTRRGQDKVEFIFAPNVGEAPRPLRAIASSGEMARVMLAIKTTLAEVDEVPILVFDEIDANVGGETATQVGKKLRGLGKTHQVICITHLPQVAAQGDKHFAVEKKTKQGRTVTQLTDLDRVQRIEEVARMLGGQSNKSVALAESLISEK